MVAIKQHSGAPAPRKVVITDAELGPEFSGWEAELRRPRLRDVDAFASEKQDDILEVLAGLVIRWNFVDEEGRPLPQPSEGGIHELDAGALEALLTAYRAKVAPKPLPEA